MEFGSMSVVDFGKIIYVQKNHAIPGLPDMNLIVFEKEGKYQAICIDIEIDAVGDTLKDACENLRKSLLAYIVQMVSNYDGNLKTAGKTAKALAVARKNGGSY